MPGPQLLERRLELACTHNGIHLGNKGLGWPGQSTTARGELETVGRLPGSPAYLSLKHPELIAQGQR